MSLTGAPLLVLTLVVAIALPLLLAWRWRRRTERSSVAPGSIGRTSIVRASIVRGLILRVSTILLCQAVAVFGVGLLVNRAFLFYDSWDDLLGRPQTGGLTPVGAGSLVPTDGSQGRVITLTVRGTVSGATQDVLVWLPPQYGERALRHTDLPVLMVLPGQPGTPAGIFKEFDFGANATAAIDRHAVTPFVAVFPPLSIAAPRDTECTDIPHGPQADSWLATDVREDVIRHVRVAAAHWSAIGYSTGGFCAAKMLLRHPSSFGAAVSVGGYFGAEQDHTTGSLFGHSRTLENQNSPLWLLQHTLSYPVRLLIVTSRADRDSWAGVFYADARKAIAAAAGVPGVESIVLATGGHNFGTYAPTIAPSFDWLGRTAGL